MSPAAQSLIEYCQSNKRVCPHKWLEMYELLPNTHQNSNGSWTPPLPLMLGAWGCTSNLEKMLRLREHIVYADDNGAIDLIDAFLRSVDEGNWHHIGE